MEQQINTLQKLDDRIQQQQTEEGEEETTTNGVF
jgi:hypothetical protein